MDYFTLQHMLSTGMYNAREPSPWYDLNSNASCCGEALQGQEFGPALFNIFINDLEKGAHIIFVKSEDTQLRGATNTREDGEATEKDVELSDVWAGNTQLKYHLDTRQVKKERNPSNLCSQQQGNAGELKHEQR